MDFKEHQHGGGTNTDIESLKFAMDRWNVKTVLDIGCGTGGQVFKALKLGLNAYGVDGTKDIPNDDRFERVDYRIGNSSFKGPFDLGWSVEFVEHVEESCIPIFMKDFKKCKRVILTAAPPFWGGKNHVNEQSELYWINAFQNYGFELDIKDSLELRNSSVTLMNGEVRPSRQQFVKIRGLVFKNKY